MKGEQQKLRPGRLVLKSDMQTGEIIYCEHLLAYQITFSVAARKTRPLMSFQLNHPHSVRVVCLRCHFLGPWVLSRATGLPSQKTGRKALSEWYKAIEKKESE